MQGCVLHGKEKATGLGRRLGRACTSGMADQGPRVGGNWACNLGLLLGLGLGLTGAQQVQPVGLAWVLEVVSVGPNLGLQKKLELGLNSGPELGP